LTRPIQPFFKPLIEVNLMSTRSISKHGISALFLTGAALAMPSSAFAFTGTYSGDSCAGCHGSVSNTSVNTPTTGTKILNAISANKGGMSFLSGLTQAQADAIAAEINAANGGATPTTKPATATPTTKPATATPTTKPATATPTTKPVITATPTTVPVTATPTTVPVTATPTTKPVVTATPTPKGTKPTATPVPSATAGKTIISSVGSQTSGSAATDVYAVTCGRGTVGLDVAITDNTSPTPVSLLTIQAVKDGAANIITAGGITTASSHHSSDDSYGDDDHNSGSSSPSQLNKGSGVYTVLISKQLSDVLGSELYTATVNCVGSSSRAPSTSYVLKQDQ
jgi:hypothetical protein